MLLSEVSFVLTESILTNIDGHFECFSFKGQKNYAYLEPSLTPAPLRVARVTEEEEGIFCFITKRLSFSVHSL
jgi:hypothetical protein